MSSEQPMREYESMIVFRADLPEDACKEQIERLLGIAESRGARRGEVHDWGIRDLAYLIQKERRGHYVLLEYDGPSAAVNELERNLKLLDVVLRYVSVRRAPGRAPVAPEAEATPVDAETAPTPPASADAPPSAGSAPSEGGA